MKRIIFILVFSILTQTTFGQSKKALSLYKSKRFAQAIPHFEKLVNKDPSIKYQSKLAICYQKTNQLKKAEAIYHQIVQHKHFNSKIMLHYADVLMGLGQYEEAKTWYLKYADENPKDPTALLKAEACDYVKTIRPYFSKTRFIPIPFNSDADDSNPMMYQGDIYFSSDRKSGFNVLKKKSGWTGRDFMKIYRVSMENDSTFSSPTPLPNKINNLNKNTGKPTFSRDGDFYFTRNTNRVSKDGTYKLHIFYAHLLPNGTWTKAEELPFCQLSINYLHPTVSEDGRTLYFASNRHGGEGGMDLYMSQKNGDRWSIPINIGNTINTPNHEAFPYIHPSGKLFFSSKGHQGFGGFDVFVSEKNEHGFWQPPVNLGAPINSSGDDIGFYADSLMSLALFSSTRNTDNDDIFMCHIDTTKDVLPPIDSVSYQKMPLEESDTINLQLTDNQVDSTDTKARYQKEFEEMGITLMDGDTIFLVAPIYPKEAVEVPPYLAGQLDQLIPAMYLSNSLNFEIYYFSQETTDIDSIAQLRADKMMDYLVERHIPGHKITATGQSLNTTNNSPIFADSKKIVILVKANADQ
ncbi:MAG TPA: hypothetical protein ENK85_09575 [Saprospiraceae bacterium]|nr:hypothetical protein [Saprospiraceae bacterium]